MDINKRGFLERDTLTFIAHIKWGGDGYGWEKNHCRSSPTDVKHVSLDSPSASKNMASKKQ